MTLNNWKLFSSQNSIFLMNEKLKSKINSQAENSDDGDGLFISFYCWLLSIIWCLINEKSFVIHSWEFLQILRNFFCLSYYTFCAISVSTTQQGAKAILIFFLVPFSLHFRHLEDEFFGNIFILPSFITFVYLTEPSVMIYNVDFHEECCSISLITYWAWSNIPFFSCASFYVIFPTVIWVNSQFPR